MSREPNLREMQKYYRQSQHALLLYLGMGLAITAVGIAIEMWGYGCPLWVWIVVAGLTWFTFVCDLINVFYLRRRIAKAERD